MATPVPFRTKKGEVFSQWKAVVNGKAVELAPNNATKEEADASLAKLLPSTTLTDKLKNPSIGDLLKKSEPTPLAAPSLSTDSKPIVSPTEKPKPGELRKNGLSELGAVKLKIFREQIGAAVASGNVSLDLAIVSVWRDKVPVIPPEQHLLLSTGWELLMQELWVDGVPPPWVIILLGNVMVCTALVAASEPKKEEELPKHDGTIGNPPKRT